MRNAEGAVASVSTVALRGAVSDRPWGATLAAIGRHGRTGQLSLRTSEGKLYRIAFANGVVVGASSPSSADSIARVALAAKLVSPAVARALGKAEDIERIALSAGLAPAQVQELKRRVIVQRTARTFAVDAGTYSVEDRVTIPTMLGIEVDIRAAIYAGVRLHLSQQRLSATLRQCGTRFVLRASAARELARYGFGDAEAPVIEALRDGTSLAELEAIDREIDPRMVEAVFATLAVCGAVIPIEALLAAAASPRREASQQEMSVARAPTPRDPTITRVPTPRQPTMSCVPMLIRQDPMVTTQVRVVTVPAKRARAPRAPTPPRTPTRSVTDPFLEVQPTRMRPSALSLDEVREIIRIGTELLERGVDHFTFLGLPYGAPIEDVREAYLEFARYLRPERLQELGIRDESFDARSVFAQVVIAYTVLTDPARRADYVRSLRP